MYNRSITGINIYNLSTLYFSGQKPNFLRSISDLKMQSNLPAMEGTVQFSGSMGSFDQMTLYYLRTEPFKDTNHTTSKEAEMPFKSGSSVLGRGNTGRISVYKCIHS